MKKFCKLLILACSIVFFVTGYAHDSKRVEVYPSVVAAVQSDPNLSTFATVIRQSGLAKKLERKGPFTVFAPTNRAFDHMSDGTLQKLMQRKNRGKLIALLREHIVYGRVSTMNRDRARQSVEVGRFKTLSGHMIAVTKRGHRYYIDNKIKLRKRDIRARNGVVHTIHTVFIPSSVKAMR